MSEQKQLKAPKTKKITLFFLALLLVGSVGMDQLTKSVAEKNFMVWESPKNSSYYESKRVHLATIGTKSKNPQDSSYISFAFNYVRNKGAAWGAFSNLKESIRTPFFHLVTILATIIIILYWRSILPQYHLARFSIALVFSGAIGNFTDRFLKGFVVDFLDVSWSLPIPFRSMNWVYDFPKFNWADSCITLGVFLLVIDMVFDKRHTKHKFGKLYQTEKTKK